MTDDIEYAILSYATRIPLNCSRRNALPDQGDPGHPAKGDPPQVRHRHRFTFIVLTEPAASQFLKFKPVPAQRWPQALRVV